MMTCFKQNSCTKLLEMIVMQLLLKLKTVNGPIISTALPGFFVWYFLNNVKISLSHGYKDLQPPLELHDICSEILVLHE